jgi:HD-like signal output (HDOD) protein
LPQTIEEWVSQLAPLELPVMRSTLQALKKLQADPNVSAARIATAVLADPMMTLKLMRIVNARRQDEFAQRIATAEHAVMMLGLSATFNQLGATAILEDVLEESAQHGLLRAVEKARHAATHARAWAVQRLDTNVEEVYIAALLHGVAEMALWVADAGSMAGVEKASRKLGWKSAQIEAYGFALPELSRVLLERWNMPPLVLDAVRPEATEAHKRPRGVMLANALVRDADVGWYGPAVIADLEEIAEARRMTPDDAAAQAHAQAAEFARRHAFPGVVPAATWLPMLPGEWPEEQTAPIATSDPFQEVMEAIASKLEGSLTLHDLMVLVMRGMRDGIGLRRIVFALLTQDRSELKAKYTFGAEEGSLLKAFSFNMRDKHLFTALMGKPQAIWMSGDNRVKYAAYLTADILKTTDGHEFFAMSLSVHGKMVGLFYGDRAGSGQRLDTASFEKFKALCTEAANSMVQLARPKPAAA